MSEREEIRSTIRDRINAELALMQDFSVPSHERYAAEERVNQYLDELLALGQIAGGGVENVTELRGEEA